MSLLTDKDRLKLHSPLRKVLKFHKLTEHGDGVVEADILRDLMPLIEAAVLSKLSAGVSVEPTAWMIEAHAAIWGVTK